MAMSDRLEHFARRVEGDEFFLASALAEYARSEGLDDAGLAAALGCPASSLPRLRLCRRPRPDAAGMREDTARIGERFGIDPLRLAEMMRRADALAAMRRDAAAGAGALIAARDRQQGTGNQADGEDGR
jgi:hypothetical protein